VRLLLTHPELPSCLDCQRWIYDPLQGWKRSERGGVAMPRPQGMPTPCRTCPKIPAGERPHPSRAVELSDENYLAYLHYQRCKAVGRFPEDAIVERNAGILRTVEEQIGRAEQARLMETLATAVTAAALKR
jgi:hypothetical protein